jgi:hypothetical protein
VAVKLEQMKRSGCWHMPSKRDRTARELAYFIPTRARDSAQCPVRDGSSRRPQAGSELRDGDIQGSRRVGQEPTARVSFAPPRCDHIAPGNECRQRNDRRN